MLREYAFNESAERIRAGCFPGCRFSLIFAPVRRHALFGERGGLGNLQHASKIDVNIPRIGPQGLLRSRKA